MTTTTTTTNTTPRPVRWHTIKFPQHTAWEAFRTAEPVQSCNPHLWHRWARAAALYEAGHVTADASGVWRVRSQTVASDWYTVTLDRQRGPRCECGDHVWRSQQWCKHTLACFIAEHTARNTTAAESVAQA